jgi:hypothetical protein
MNESEKQFSFTRAASSTSTSGRARSKFLSVKQRMRNRATIRSLAHGVNSPAISFTVHNRHWQSKHQHSK